MFQFIFSKFNLFKFLKYKKKINFKQKKKICEDREWFFQPKSQHNENISRKNILRYNNIIIIINIFIYMYIFKLEKKSMIPMLINLFNLKLHKTFPEIE